MSKKNLQNFHEVAGELLSCNAIVYPDFDKQFTIMVDSSDICLGYCFVQDAITKGLEYFAFFLKNAKHPILILTDHKLLLSIQTSSYNTKFIEMLSYKSEYPSKLCYVHNINSVFIKRKRGRPSKSSKVSSSLKKRGRLSKSKNLSKILSLSNTITCKCRRPKKNVISSIVNETTPNMPTLSNADNTIFINE
uniref:RT_RNaseH_2 domain-containing protein n=1 Tax=Strongyloides stercoralis TaxID=6248 RepID=A0A0K0EBX6_STRER